MIIVNCTTCNKKVKKYKQNKKGFYFCSTNCYTNFRKNNKNIFPNPPINSGSNNFRWNGGQTVDRYGYTKVFDKDNPMSDSKGYVYLHRLIFSKSVGRVLLKNEWVHHKNENKRDNRLENLELMTEKQHKTYHGKKSSNLPSLKNYQITQ